MFCFQIFHDRGSPSNPDWENQPFSKEKEPLNDEEERVGDGTNIIEPEGMDDSSTMMYPRHAPNANWGNA